MVGFSIGNFDVMKMIVTPLLWLFILLGIVIFTFGFLWLRKRKKLRYPAAEIVDLGGGKSSINFLGVRGAGWFGKAKMLFGLWDYGDEVMRTREGQIVEQFSEQDFQEVNGQRGVVFFRDPVRRLLFPVNRLQVENGDLTAAIAPADYTDVAVDIVKKASEETQDKYKSIMQVVAIAVVAIICLILVVMIIQFANGRLQKADELTLAGQKACLESAEQVCGRIVSQFAKASAAP